MTLPTQATDIVDSDGTSESSESEHYIIAHVYRKRSHVAVVQVVNKTDFVAEMQTLKLADKTSFEPCAED